MGWQWEFTAVLSIADLGRSAISLAVCDGILWLLTNEVHPVSGEHGRIYYSTNGTDYTEDAAWGGLSDCSGTYWGGQLFVHQGKLHLLCNQNGNDGQIYRRVDGVWGLLQEQAAGSKLRYATAHSNDVWIIVCGYEFNAVPAWTEAVIWKWDGAAMTEEFHADHTAYPYDYNGLRAIYYDGEWYAYNARWFNASTAQAVLRLREDDGSWSLLRIYSGAITDAPYLTTTTLGLLWGDDLWDTNGNWRNVAYSGQTGAAYQYGEIITVSSSATAYVYTLDGRRGAGWEYHYRPADPSSVYDIQDFGGQLYMAGKQAAGPRVWRVTINHGVPGVWPHPTARLLVCDHEFGDTLYVGIYKDDELPLWLGLSSDFGWWEKIYEPTSGSFIGVQTAFVADVAYAFGFLGSNNQVRITVNGGYSTADADDDWGEDKVTSLEHHPTSGSDLILTLYTGQDLKQTLTGTKPWTQLSNTPIVPRCQMRHMDDVWVGGEASASPVRMYSGGSWADKSTGLPNVAINDLEVGS